MTEAITMKAQRGTRDKLEKYFDLKKPLKIKLQIRGSAVYDFTCFGVDANEKLSDDRYMIFYNQTSSALNFQFRLKNFLQRFRNLFSRELLTAQEK
jgi:stress response protein SCP2